MCLICSLCATAEVPLEAVLEDEEMLAALDAAGDGTASLVPDDEDDDELIGAAAKGSAKKKKGAGKSKKAAKPAATASAENRSPNAEAAALAAGKKGCSLPGNINSLEYEANQKEAAAKGYGKLYAEFGGGKEGLQACSAGLLCP